jgi:hypothetical protein
MKSKFITLIWLATFENQTQLTDYVEWKYLENEDDPKCSFADDIGLKYFDNDFLESAFVATPSKLLEQIDNISFVENFKGQLLTKINDINYSDKNSIISLSGKKDVYGGINEMLFDFTPTLNDKEYLQFVGLYKYEAT